MDSPSLSAPSLKELAKLARAPGASIAEVNALFFAMRRPLVAGETHRERADVLLRILGDSRIRALAHDDGRTVREVACQALRELGPPYADEVPAELLPEDDSRHEPGPPVPPLSSLKTQAGLAFLGFAAAWETFMVFVPPARTRYGGPYLPIALPAVALMLVLPTVLALVAHQRSQRHLYNLSISWLLLVGGLGGVLGFISLLGDFRYSLLMMALGALKVTGTCLLDRGLKP
jgi:hypothetical protein